MESSGVIIEEGILRQTYSGAAWKRAMCRYSVDFEINGKRYSAWVNPHDGGFYSDCPAPQREGLYGAAAELERIISQPKPHLDSLGLRKFLYEHLRAMIEVETELLDNPVAECQREFLNAKPVDMEELSLEEQWLFELIKEEAEKANQARVGTSNDVTTRSRRTCSKPKRRRISKTTSNRA
jgi:hypothetical protein